MLYPEFNDLIKLKSFTKKKSPNRKSSSKYCAGENETKLLGQGMEFAEVRKYTFGDDIRHIDWKVSARTNTTHSKLYIAETDNVLVMFLDLSPYMHFGTVNTFKSIIAAKIFAALGFNALSGNNKICVIFYGHQHRSTWVSTIKSARDFYKTLKVLCSPTTYSNPGTEPLSNAIDNYIKLLPSNSLVVFISDTLAFDNKTLKKISLLKKTRQIMIIDVNDPADIKLPELTNVDLLSTQHHFKVDSLPMSLKNDYKEQWVQSNNYLDTFTKRNRIFRVQLSTATPVYSSIKLCLDNVNRRRL